MCNTQSPSLSGLNTLLGSSPKQGPNTSLRNILY